MEFFIHSATGCFSKDLKKLVNEHGMAGLGFFWMALEKILLCNRPVPLIDLVQKGFNGLSRTQASNIIINSGLFYFDENELVTLVDKVDYGIDKKTLETYFAKLSLCTPSCACMDKRVDKRMDKRMDMSVDAGHCKLNKEKKREENIARETLLIFLEERCPHLLEMAEPLTLEQYRELKKSYSEEQIKEVLLDMENDVGLSNRRRSCFQTTSSWLKKRFGPSQGGNKKNGSAVFCGLDENGTPILIQQKNNNNGKKDSNSYDGSAAAEQQGDGSGCAQQPDD
jgi:hypothetical protein